jgi:DNA-binding transcriptional regulator YhcF (GntR family)
MRQSTFDVAQKCKGKLTTRAIADQLGIKLKDVQKAMQELEDARILEWKEIG